jgi:acyl transferase domain-containing protein/acyl carrier protein
VTAIEPIAIVGIGCRLPGGVKNPDDLWKLLVDGVDAITEVPEDRWHSPAMYHSDLSKPGRANSRWGGFLDNVDRFDAQFFGISPREAAAADPQQRLLLEVAYEAVEDAGLTLSALAGKRAGVYIGMSSFDYSGLQVDRSTIDSYTSLGSVQCVAANRISYFFDLIGPSLTVDTACSSSLVAAHLACQSIWNGESELAFVAGVNLMLRPETTIAAAKASMLSPDGRCKAFDSRANGFVRGEGGAVIILKPFARALADRDRIYALIRATAVNQDGRTEGITVPRRASQEANLRDALRLADIAPESVQYVEAHGTGTPVGDPIEASALGAVYGKTRGSEDCCVIGSIKTNMGHLEAGAGIAGLIKAVLCLGHRQIPANLHFEKPNPQIPFDDLRLRVAQRLEPWPETHGQPPRAGVNSFGFGGTNGHVILEAPPQQEIPTRTAAEPADGRTWMLPLSVRNASALPDLARTYLNALRDECGFQDVPLRDICFSAATKRTHYEHRLVLVADDKAELAEQIEAFLRGEHSANSSTGRASGEPARPVFVCSGMGQQWWAMGRELLTREPVYRRAVEEVNDLYRPLAGWSLMDKLMADEQSSEIQQTHIAQPAIFATQIGLAVLWRSWGIEPAVVFGHSAGEVAAAYIAGALSLEDAIRVKFHRSRLLRRTVGQGVMLAAGIPREEAERLVARHRGVISLAAINAHSSVTLSGDAAVLAEIEQALAEAGLFSRALQVEAPFHSQKMDQIETELLESLRDIRPRTTTTQFFSTVTGTTLSGLELDGPHWYRSTRQTVLFSDVMAQLIKAKHNLFLEIGAHPVLRYDIAACLKENAAQGTTLCSVRRGERERAAMLGSLGRMHTLGAEIDWQKVFPADATAIKLPSYPFQADSHWREPEQARRKRMGLSVHPLLGSRLEAPQPTWQVAIDTAGLSYLTDHRVGGAIAFPSAGFVEMALAAARETFGTVPCVLENVEFQKLFFVDEDAAGSAQVMLDTASSDFSVFARTDASELAWDRHARGCVRQSSQPIPDKVDLAQIRRRCPDPIGREEYYGVFDDIGLHYGPTFRGIARLWRGEREALAEIQTPSGISEQLSNYLLHPAILDACFHSAMAAIAPGKKVELYLPVKIERFRFYSTPSADLFAHVQLKEFDPTELKADIELLDESGNLLVEMQGLVCRPTGHRAQGVNSTLYEYQWKLAPRPVSSGARKSKHLPTPEILAPVMQQEGEALRQRLDRTRFQNEFRALSQASASAYIVCALRELGWTPGPSAMTSIESLADQLKVAPPYHQWLRLVLKKLSAGELASTEPPHRLWKAGWDQFPECQVEMTLVRKFGEQLPAVLRGDVDPLTLIFSEGTLASTEHLYHDSPTLRFCNLLVQKTVEEIVRRLPKGSALRILEIGGGTGGITSFLLPVLPEHSTEYVFTDVSLRFIAHAQHKFAQYPFVQYRPLDIELDPIEQGFAANSFDLIIASDVHATQDLRKTLDRVKQLLGSSGIFMLLEPTHPWLYATLIFGLLKSWWLFQDHDLRPDEPCLSQQKWKSLMGEAGFSHPICVADCPNADSAQYSVILTRGPQLSESPALAAPASQAQAPKELKAWMLFADDGAASHPSAGAGLVLRFRERGDRVIQVFHGAEFRQAGLDFTVRAGDPDDMRRLLDGVTKEAPRLAGVVHLWSLDIETTESMTSHALKLSARLGCVGVLQLLQAMQATEGLIADDVWLITRSAQPMENRAAPLEVAQSPLWGLGRVATNEYPNLRCRLVDLATCSQEEIASLADELRSTNEMEDEIALHGELRYVHRLVPTSPATMHRVSLQTGTASQPFRIELQRPGILDSLSPRKLVRMPPKPHEIEIQVVATGLNFKDLLMAMGMLPKEAMTTSSAGGKLLGLECAGRVVAVGDAVSEFAVGDEVVAVAGGRSLATHITVDAQVAALKPKNLSFEQIATVPVAYLTAWYSLHLLGQLKRGERVLIHSGTGGVGLAALQVALKAGAVVFATAGLPEKRELLTALGAAHVMDSRSLTFADEVLDLTQGEGVDLVLNSLVGEAIDKGLSSLRLFGRFIDIGLRDIYQNRKIGMLPLRKNVSLFAVDLGSAFEQQPEIPGAALRKVMKQFASNDLRALPHRVFPITRVADAFRYMAQAKYVGKLVISIEDADGLQVEDGPSSLATDADASYLITGGLGGLGLAVADRLARRGARHLALVGRSAPSPAAQTAVESLRQRGVEVMICEADIADRDQAQRVIAEVQRTMGPLRGVVHTAMVLDDAPIEHLTEERMWKVMDPKILGAWNLHVLTAETPLDFFVLFSSFSTIIGTPGQANYVAGNAFLDALAYYRRARGLPAVAVDWGAVGEVGHVAKSRETAERIERLGMIVMPLSETLDTLDHLMSNNAVQVAVVNLDWKALFRSTIIRVAARFTGLGGETSADEDRSTAGSGFREILEADEAALPPLLETYLRNHLARSMGASPARIDTQQSLLSLGLDSLIAVEVRNRINADLGVNVSLARFTQSASISTLAAYIGERLLESDSSERSKAMAYRIVPGDGSRGSP